MVVMSLALLLAILPNSASSQTSSSPNTSATAVPLLLPSAIAFDPQGNLYLADSANHLIRKVDTTGHITTIVGTGTQGFSGDAGQANAAQLDSPQGLALNPGTNTLYIADTHNHRIRQLNLTTGIITTIAGTGTPSFSGDSTLATNATLNLPTGLAVDTINNLYVSDTANHRIRRIDAITHIITTIAGNGTQGFSGDGGQATQATIDSPTGLAVDTLNNLYLSDTANHRIRRIDAITRIITTLAGIGTQGFSGDGLSSTAATLAFPTGLTLDASGNLYFADTANHRIRRIDATTGAITTVVGNGTQTFSGDTLTAASASLDSPRATVISPTGLLTLADTENLRIRQRATDANINTIAGLGTTIAGTLTLTAPSVVAYATGTLTAHLISPTAASGTITFLDTWSANGSTTTTTLGTANLLANTATTSTATLPAGLHTLTATFAGDLTHASAQSPATTLTITPRQLTAINSSINTLYGLPIPGLTGTLIGVLPSDSANIIVNFTSSATTLSPAGIYPITASITGSAAGNYTLLNTQASLTIAPAPATTTITASASNPAPGAAIALAAHVVTTTAGYPTGNITFLDGTIPLSSAPIDATGTAALVTSTLSTGSHTLTALYSGDTNFLASTSTPTLVTVGTASPTDPDFTLAATGNASQTTFSGTPANFTFAVQMQSVTLSSPIALAASGLPLGATASFNPAYLPPGTLTNAFTLTISTPRAVAVIPPTPPRIALLTFLLFPLFGVARRTYPAALRHSSLRILPLALLASALCQGCGNRINTGTQSTTPSQTYVIAVTATATSPAGAILQHTANVTLQLQ